MDNRVLTAWAIFLALAYVLTLAVLPILFGVIRAANRIARNSARTLPAAVGILTNTESIAGLKTTETVGGEILNTAQALVGGAGSIEGQLSKAGL
ncbi:MAG: hypothetical protein ACR2NN_07770 [Bryobacteraceae bacterium]